MKLPKAVLAAALEREKLKAGVEAAVATLVVNRGERVPAEKLVTVPPPNPLTVRQPCTVPPLSMPHTWFALPLVLMAAATLAMHPV